MIFSPLLSCHNRNSYFERFFFNILDIQMIGVLVCKSMLFRLDASLSQLWKRMFDFFGRIITMHKKDTDSFSGGDALRTRLGYMQNNTLVEPFPKADFHLLLCFFSKRVLEESTSRGNRAAYFYLPPVSVRSTSNPSRLYLESNQAL